MAYVLLLLAMFVVSPVSLQMPRLVALCVVLALVMVAWLMRDEKRIRAKIELWAILYFAFMALNAIVSTLNGNSGRDALSELVPAGEVLACFFLASRVEFDATRAARWAFVILVVALTRALWQLILIFSGIPIIPPIYDVEHAFKAQETIGNFVYVRPIDPVVGIFVAIAFVFYVCDVHRRLAITVMAVSGAVSLLGLTRSEWIASVVCMILTAAFVGGTAVRRWLTAAAVIAAAMVLLTMAVPDFNQFLANRLFQYTQQQIEDPSNELAELRFLEIGTAVAKFSEAPILGHGLGSDFGTQVWNGSFIEFVQFHNYYLNLLANAGLAGLIALLLVAYKSFRFGTALIRAARDPVAKAISICAIATLVWWAIFVTFQPIYSTYHVTVLIGLFFGMALALQAPAPDSQLSEEQG